MTEMAQKPLVVDLDGTLFVGDSTWENLRILFLRQPLKIPEMLGRLLRGRASLKCWLYEETGGEGQAAALAMRTEVIQTLQRAKRSGRAVHLVSGAPQRLVGRTARRLGLNPRMGHWGCQPGANLTHAKRSFLIQRFGSGGFDYLGDCQIDLPIFVHAHQGAVVGARPGMVRQALRANPRLRVMAPQPSFGTSAWRALRPHQWIKNILLLVPLLSAHAWNQPQKWLVLLGGMVAFSLLSSAVYLLNDLYDLEVDRLHPLKKARPLANGDLKIPEAVGLCLFLGLISFGLAWWISGAFLACAGIYLAMALVYNGWAKRMAGLDLVGLASFYALRILAGGAAVGIVCSPWLLGYAIFFFLSLACIKRVSELLRLKAEKKEAAGGRSYEVGDLEAMIAIGTASGVVSILVAAMYVNSPDVRILYARPQLLLLLCPILFYWIIRAWLRTLRRRMPEDPVLFALKDRASWLLLFFILMIGIAASR